MPKIETTGNTSTRELYKIISSYFLDYKTLYSEEEVIQASSFLEAKIGVENYIILKECLKLSLISHQEKFTKSDRKIKKDILKKYSDIKKFAPNLYISSFIEKMKNFNSMLDCSLDKFETIFAYSQNHDTIIEPTSNHFREYFKSHIEAFINCAKYGVNNYKEFMKFVENPLLSEDDIKSIGEFSELDFYNPRTILEIYNKTPSDKKLWKLKSYINNLILGNTYYAKYISIKAIDDDLTEINYFIKISEKFKSSHNLEIIEFISKIISVNKKPKEDILKKYINIYKDLTQEEINYFYKLLETLELEPAKIFEIFENQYINNLDIDVLKARALDLALNDKMDEVKKLLESLLNFETKNMIIAHLGEFNFDFSRLLVSVQTPEQELHGILEGYEHILSPCSANMTEKSCETNMFKNFFLGFLNCKDFSAMQGFVCDNYNTLDWDNCNIEEVSKKLKSLKIPQEYESFINDFISAILDIKNINGDNYPIKEIVYTRNSQGGIDYKKPTNLRVILLLNRLMECRSPHNLQIAKIINDLFYFYYLNYDEAVKDNPIFFSDLEGEEDFNKRKSQADNRINDLLKQAGSQHSRKFLPIDFEVLDAEITVSDYLKLYNKGNISLTEPYSSLNAEDQHFITNILDIDPFHNNMLSWSDAVLRIDRKITFEQYNLFPEEHRSKIDKEFLPDEVLIESSAYPGSDDEELVNHTYREFDDAFNNDSTWECLDSIYLLLSKEDQIKVQENYPSYYKDFLESNKTNKSKGLSLGTENSVEFSCNQEHREFDINNLIDKLLGGNNLSPEEIEYIENDLDVKKHLIEMGIYANTLVTDPQAEVVSKTPTTPPL